MIDLFIIPKKKKEILNHEALQHTYKDIVRKFAHVYKNCHNKASLLSIDQVILSSLALWQVVLVC